MTDDLLTPEKLERLAKAVNGIEWVDKIPDSQDAEALSAIFSAAAKALREAQQENADLAKQLRAVEGYRDQCGAAHEFLDAISVPETDDGKPMNIAERICWTTLHDDWDDPEKVADTILSASSNPAWHNLQREKAEADLRAAGEREERLREWSEFSVPEKDAKGRAYPWEYRQGFRMARDWVRHMMGWEPLDDTARLAAIKGEFDEAAALSDPAGAESVGIMDLSTGRGSGTGSAITQTYKSIPDPAGERTEK